MLTLSLIGGVFGLVLLTALLVWVKAFKLAKFLVLIIVGIFAVIFMWESLSGVLIYLLSDFIETIVTYWGASLLGFVLVISALVFYWRSK